MTLQTRIPPSNPDCLWESAARAANAWRGEAIQIFAQAELCVSETLEALAAVPERGNQVKLRRLVGQRFGDLTEALTATFAAEGAKAAAALEEFRRHEELRPYLSHGAGRLALERSGRWIVVLKVTVFRSGGTERGSRVIEQGEAERILGELRADCRALQAALQSLRDRVGRRSA